MDSIVFTPVEFLPWLVLIGFLIPLAFTAVKGILAYQETAKDKLRSGKWTTAPGYGMDYLAANIGVIIVGAAATVIIPGMIYAALEATPSMAGCLTIGLLVALVVGIKGPKTLADVVDMFRNASKIKDLETKEN